MTRQCSNQRRPSAAKRRPCGFVECSPHWRALNSRADPTSLRTALGRADSVVPARSFAATAWRWGGPKATNLVETMAFRSARRRRRLAGRGSYVRSRSRHCEWDVSCWAVRHTSVRWSPIER